MDKEQKFILSPYAIIVNNNHQKTLMYHSLLGNARIMDRRLNDLVEFCKTERSKEELIQKGSESLWNNLYKLGYIHNQRFDDRMYFDELLRKRSEILPTGSLVSHLQLVLTNACNMGCEYCFAKNFQQAVSAREICGDGSGYEENINERNKKGVMTFDTARKCIDQAIFTIKKNNQNHLSISFFGGEPTLNRPLIESILNHYGNGKNHLIQIEYDINTNGSQIDDSLITLFSKYNVRVEVSIDYIDEARGQFRGGKQTGTLLASILNTIRKLKKAQLNVQLSSVLSSHTWKYWGFDLIDFASQENLPEINVIVSFEFDCLKEYGPIQVADKILDAYDYGKKKNVLLTGYWYHTFLLLLDDEKRALQADYKTCPAIGRMLSIEPDGSVFACKMTSRRMGHINHWNDIFRSSEYRYYAMRAFSNSTDCHGCELEGFCSGSPCGSLEESDDIYSMEKGYCAYMKRIVRGLIDRLLEEENYKKES